MRRVAITLWHSLLIVLLVWGLFAALIAAAGQFAPAWHAPGLELLVLVVTVEAIGTQRLMARERRRIEEQVGARGLELVVIILLVRVWSLRAETDPLLQTIGPWLRSPLEFFGGRFPDYFVWTLLAWFVATVLAANVLDWGEDDPARSQFDTTIEREQMQQEWRQAITRYDRRFVAIMLLTFTASAFAIHRAADDPSAAPVLPAVAAVTGLVAGLLLHSAGQLKELRRNWSVDNIEVDAGLGRRWNRPAVLLIGGLVLLAPLMGWVVLIAPPPPLVPVANAILSVLTIIVSVTFLIILAPILLILALLRGGTPSVPTPMQFQPPQIPDSAGGGRPLIPALIFWGCVVLLIVLALTRYLRDRSDLRDALRRWRVMRWLFLLAGWAGEWASDALGWAGMAAAAVRRFARRRRKQVIPPRPRGAQAQLRALYRQMKQAGTRRGVPPGLAQTPYEYGAALGQRLPIAQQDVEGLTETYVRAEYGPRPAGPTDLQRARRHWRRLQRWLFQSSGLRRRGKGRGQPRQS